jgi:osmoprotectant transport system ATP-binding protein
VAPGGLSSPHYDLVTTASIAVEDKLEDASPILSDARCPWAVVLDEHGSLAGSVGQEMLHGTGAVAERTRRTEACVHLADSLKAAFGEMVQWDAGRIAVLDPRNQRYLGVLTPGTLHAPFAAPSTPRRPSLLDPLVVGMAIAAPRASGS